MPIRWLRGLRRGSAAARLLRSWVRIPPGPWMSVCCECCAVSGRELCDELIPRQRSSTECRAQLCVIQKPHECEGPGPLGAVVPKEEKKMFYYTFNDLYKHRHVAFSDPDGKVVQVETLVSEFLFHGIKISHYFCSISCRHINEQ